ncbi:hypothetical protein E2C01_062662 [Portunus trituberculatus]|uniref:Uncharacterized protein n=1 Tax=Portunus trituberculatus TaxID=210409 RepID=A0A5B7H8H7_PORTR|nr:hypothetical protein [Portunus trituberculatus]
MTSRLNILKAITSYASGASCNAKRVFYAVAYWIRSLVDYSVPCLIAASPALLNETQLIQNQARRLIASVPRWTKVLNLKAETQMVAITQDKPAYSHPYREDGNVSETTYHPSLAKFWPN